MRIEKRDVTYTHTVYIAEDGKEFNQEYECRWHEQKTMLSVAEDRIKHLKIKPVPDFPLVSENVNCISWYNITSENDFDLILNYYKLWDECFIYESDCPNKYPAIVYVVESTDDYSYAYMGNIEDVITDLKNVFLKLGYNAEFKKGE